MREVVERKEEECVKMQKKCTPNEMAEMRRQVRDEKCRNGKVNGMRKENAQRENELQQHERGNGTSGLFINITTPGERRSVRPKRRRQKDDQSRKEDVHVRPKRDDVRLFLPSP